MSVPGVIFLHVVFHIGLQNLLAMCPRCHIRKRPFKNFSFRVEFSVCALFYVSVYTYAVKLT